MFSVLMVLGVSTGKSPGVAGLWQVTRFFYIPRIVWLWRGVGKASLSDASAEPATLDPGWRWNPGISRQMSPPDLQPIGKTGKKSWHPFRLRTGVHAMPYPRGVSDPEQVEGAMPYDSEDGYPRFFRQGIRSGRLPLHGPV